MKPWFGYDGFVSLNFSLKLGVVNGPLKNKKSLQILPKSRNLAQKCLRFYVRHSHRCFSIKSLNFSVLVSDCKVPILASLRVSDLPFAPPPKTEFKTFKISLLYSTG